MQPIHSTTVLAVKLNGQIAIGADSQATMNNYVAKSNVKKTHSARGKIVCCRIRSDFDLEFFHKNE